MAETYEAFLHGCRIRRGMFDFERFVEIEIDGVTHTTIASHRDVKEESVPTGTNSVNGRLRVHNVKRHKDDKYFVILPREVMGQGRRLLVPKEMLRIVAA